MLEQAAARRVIGACLLPLIMVWSPVGGLSPEGASHHADDRSLRLPRLLRRPPAAADARSHGLLAKLVTAFSLSITREFLPILYRLPCGSSARAWGRAGRCVWLPRYCAFGFPAVVWPWLPGRYSTKTLTSLFAALS